MPQHDYTAAFRALHDKGNFLILANVWDAASARLTQEAGAKAIATSSAALAWANGYPDGDALPVDVHARAVEAIARVIDLPLSVDSEGGYSDDPAQAAENIGRLIDAGAVGINLEDGTGAPELLAAKIEAVKGVAAKRGVDLFVNARVDTVLHSLVPAEDAAAETIRRARLYASAGADGIFAPGVTEAQAVAQIVEAVDPLPLNLLVWPGLAPLDDLKAAGVRRLSAGGRIARGAYSHAYASATDLLKTGSASDLLSRTSDELPNLNALLGEE